MSFTLFLARCYGSRTPSLCSRCGREGPWAPIAESLAPWLMPQWEMWWARCCLGFSGATSLSVTCTEPGHGFKLSKLMSFMSVLLWEEKRLAVFYPSWAGNHARLILFTSLGSCCLQIQHSWCPCCKPSAWSNPDAAFPKLWHHSSQIVSWGTAVPSEAPVLQTHWQTCPGAIKPGVTSLCTASTAGPRWFWGASSSCTQLESQGDSVRSPSALQLKCARPQSLKDIWLF